MRRGVSAIARAAVVVTIATTACDRPRPLVICHNANCVEPPEPRRDDTLDALRASLALAVDGRPAIDGVEIDLFWHGQQNRCLFAHDLSTTPAASAGDVAAELAQYIARPEPIASRDDVPFTVLIELKGHVGPSKSDAHTPAQRAAHAACAVDVVATLDAAAATAGRDVDLVVTSFDPRLLAAVAAEPRWRLPPARARRRLGAIVGIPAPLDSQTRPLSEFGAELGIDLVEVHPQWLLDGQYEAYDHAGYELAFWMFSATVETLAAIDRYEPAMVVTSEARLVRRWLR